MPQRLGGQPVTRRSPREIERRLGDMDGGEEYPTAYLVRILSYDWVSVDEERHLYRAENDGQVYRWDRAIVKKIQEMVE